MVKKLLASTLIIASVMTSGVYADPPLPTPAPLGCGVVNYQDKSFLFGTVSRLIDLVTLVSKPFKSKFDPYVISNKPLESKVHEVLGTQFQLTPSIQTMTVQGLSSLKINNIEITSPTTLKTSANFEAPLTVNATIQLKIEQLKSNQEGAALCWTNPLSVDGNCPPALIDLNLGMILTNPRGSANTKVQMLKCPDPATDRSCSDISTFDIIAAVVPSKLESLIKRLILRLDQVQIVESALEFDAISTDVSISVGSTTSASFMEILRKGLGFTQEQLNQEGSKSIVQRLNQWTTQVVNKVIEVVVSPQFGHSCFDP